MCSFSTISYPSFAVCFPMMLVSLSLFLPVVGWYLFCPPNRSLKYYLLILSLRSFYSIDKPSFAHFIHPTTFLPPLLFLPVGWYSWLVDLVKFHLLTKLLTLSASSVNCLVLYGAADSGHCFFSHHFFLFPVSFPFFFICSKRRSSRA